MSVKPNPAHRGDPLFLPEVLKLWGVRVNELPGWRNIGHGDFGRIQGVVVHHTGTNANIPGYIQRHPQLGLCSQIHLSREGVADVCGAGIAWHAGRGSFPGWPTDAANGVSIGVEAASDGVSPWPAAQLDAYHRVCAAILWYLGKPATSAHLISHAEYSARAQGKWDPGAGVGKSGVPIDMGVFRAKVQEYLDNPPWGSPAGGKVEEGFVSGLDEVFRSIVPGSSYEAPLKQMIVNADGHSYSARVAAEANQRELAALKVRLESLERLVVRVAEKLGV